MSAYSAAFPALSDHQMRTLVKLCDKTVEWNGKVNLISRKDIDLLVENHVLPSLAVTKVGLLCAGDKVIDVGTGGGFPGLPLAIACPEVSFTLLDSNNKKMMVVADIVKALALTNVQVVCARAEDHQGQFDFILGRAVSSIPTFLSFSQHLMQAGGRGGVIYIKGGDYQEELCKANISSKSTAINTLLSLDTDKSILFIPADQVRRFNAKKGKVR